MMNKIKGFSIWKVLAFGTVILVGIIVRTEGGRNVKQEGLRLKGLVY